MRFRTIQPFWIDAVGAVTAVLILVGGYYLLIRRPMNEGRNLDQTRSECERLSQNLTNLHTQSEQLQREVESLRQKLGKVGGGLPKARDIDRYLAQVTSVAEQSGVTVDSMTPLPLRDAGDHQEVYVNFSAHGSYPAFHRLMRGMEQQLEYADVTHFAIHAGDSGNESVCRGTWSLRICIEAENRVIKAVARVESK